MVSLFCYGIDLSFSLGAQRYECDWSYWAEHLHIRVIFVCNVARVPYMRYLVVLERSKTVFGAYVPDLPGCVAVGETRNEALRLIREGIELHIEKLRDSGESVPSPTSQAEIVEVDAA